MPEQTTREQIQPILKTLKLAAAIDEGSVNIKQEGCNSLASLLEMLVGNYENLKKEYGRVFAECAIRGLKLSGAENEVAKLNFALATAVACARRDALEEAAEVATGHADCMEGNPPTSGERIASRIAVDILALRALAATSPEARQTETAP